MRNNEDNDNELNIPQDASRAEAFELYVKQGLGADQALIALTTVIADGEVEALSHEKMTELREVLDKYYEITNED